MTGMSEKVCFATVCPLPGRAGIRRGFFHEGWIVPKHTDPLIADRAQQPAHFAGGMVMIHGKFADSMLERCRRRCATDGAYSPLPNHQGIIFRDRDPVALQKSGARTRDGRGGEVVCGIARLAILSIAGWTDGASVEFSERFHFLACRAAEHPTFAQFSVQRRHRMCHRFPFVHYLDGRSGARQSELPRYLTADRSERGSRGSPPGLHLRGKSSCVPYRDCMAERHTLQEGEGQ